MKLTVVYAEPQEELDGIHAHAQHLVAALNEHTSLEAELTTISRDGATLAEAARSAHADVVNLHYNPFSYGRRGFAPWLMRQVGALRRHSRARMVLTVHEAYVPARSWRWALMGGWQRAQLAFLARAADAIVISTESWRRPLATMAGRRPITMIPVGSNLPDRRLDREHVRAEKGWDGETLVVAAFGADPAARLDGYVTSTVTTLARSEKPVAFANLGASPLRVRSLPPTVTHFRPGYLPPSEVARALAASDVFLAPYEDGVSLRRTTLAAAFQHGLAVVGTDGRNTDDELRTSEALLLVRLTDTARFAAAVSQMATPTATLRARTASRGLFERYLAWPVIAGRYHDVLTGFRPGETDHHSAFNGSHPTCRETTGSQL